MSQQQADVRSQARSGYDGKGGAKRPKDRLPPTLEWWEHIILWGSRIIGFVSLIGFFYICIITILSPANLPICACRAYLALILVLLAIIVDRTLRHRYAAHEARLQDRSEVEKLFEEANSVERRLINPEKPDNFDEKKDIVQGEIKRLKSIEPHGWTEYQLLFLKRLLVDFKKPDDLITYARSSLDELSEYAYDDAYRYDVERFGKWDARVEDAIFKLQTKLESEECKKEIIDEAAERLRAVQRTLLEHITEYEAYWAEGTSLIKNLIFVCIGAALIFIVMGIIPVLYYESPKLEVYNWGSFGVGGALTAILLHLYKLNRVEVGQTEGRGELQRAIIGSMLGFVAGVVLFWIIAGGIIATGTAVPELESPEFKDIGLSIVLAFAAGYFFEGVLDRVPKPLAG